MTHDPPKKTILLTNDDGIRSPGLWAAAAALAPLGYVTVAAPLNQWSGAGRSMPYHSEGRIYEESVTVGGQTWKVYAVDGTPAQAVQHGLVELMPAYPDLIVAGINYGENVGSGVTISGTVGAALEGASFGVPGLAISLQTDSQYHLTHSTEIDFAAAAYFTHKFARLLLGLPRAADLDVLKIEVPDTATPATAWRFTRLSRTRYYLPQKPPERRHLNDQGKIPYARQIEPDRVEADSDVRALVDGVVSVTPLSLDITSRVDLPTLQQLYHQADTDLQLKADPPAPRRRPEAGRASERIVMQAFYDYLDAHHDQFLAELKRYLRQPSVAAQNLGMAEMAQLTQERLEARGFAVQILPTGGFPVVYGEIGQGPRTLLIYDHYDVQPPEPLDLWETPAFEPTERNGNLYARGAADNKGDQMCRMQAIEAWLATRGDLPLKIKWVIEGEEEIGSPNLEHFAREHAALLQADGCLWETGGRNELDQFGLWLGLKGIAYFELRLKTMDTDAHSANAPMLPNPAWRLVWALSTLKGPDDVITLDGYWPHVTPPTPDEVALVDRLPYDGEKIKAIYGAKRFINDMDARQAKRAFYFNPTLTICGFDSGYTGEGAKTVLPKDARVKLDFRLVPNLTPDVVYDLLRQHLDRRGFEDVEIVRFAGEHSASSSADASVVQAAIRAARQVYGADPIIYPRMPGSGPMYPLSNMLGIPAVLAGITHQGAKAHAPNEHIRLSEYWLGQKFIGEFIREFAAA